MESVECVCECDTTARNWPLEAGHPYLDAGVVNGAEWLGGNSQQVTGDSGLI